MIKFGVVIPTLNGGELFRLALNAIQQQDISPVRFIVIDSGSTDGTVDLATAAGAEVVQISKRDFNHGGTRMLGVRLVEESCDAVVFLTQDAILSEPSAFRMLLSAFNDDDVLVAYGRQLPRPNAGPIEAFARLHNYPENSETRSASDIPRIGFKTCFCSNSFSAYRVSSLISGGGFPTEVIFGEDALMVAKLILDGGRIRYEASARVIHSHEYTIREEFSRFFDIGVMHHRGASVLAAFGSPQGAGGAYFKSEIQYLLKMKVSLVPEAFLRTFIKFFAYKIGKAEEFVPRKLKKSISMNRNFWNIEVFE